MDMGWDDDETFEEREERKKRGYSKKGIVWPDGRMRPGYNAHVTVTGRLSSSKPINAQNFPKNLRAMIVAQPGNVLVGADADQLELRIAAGRWDLQKYKEALTNNWDPHTSVTAYAVFGKAFEKAAGSPFPWMTGTKFDGDAHRMRQLSKIIQYAFQYKAGVETGHRIITSTELEDGSFPTSSSQSRTCARCAPNGSQAFLSLRQGGRRRSSTTALMGGLQSLYTGASGSSSTERTPTRS